MLGSAAETGRRRTGYRVFVRGSGGLQELGTAFTLSPECVRDERTSGKHCPVLELWPGMLELLGLVEQGGLVL